MRRSHHQAYGLLSIRPGAEEPKQMSLLGRTRLVDVLKEQNTAGTFLERLLERRVVALGARDGDERAAVMESSRRHFQCVDSPPVMRIELAALG